MVSFGSGFVMMSAELNLLGVYHNKPTPFRIATTALRFKVRITSKVENLQLGDDVLQLCCNWTSKCCNSKGGRFVVGGMLMARVLQ